MRAKLLVGALGLAAAVLAPVGFASGGSAVAIDCPVSGLQPACGAVNVVVATACTDPLPSVPTVGFITVDVEGGPPVVCPV